MIKPNTVIGLSGVAGCGKDTFLALLAKQIPDVKRFALADNLKNELNGFFLEQYGIDIFTCERKTKDILRPILVTHGKMRRLDSSGKHWTSKLEREIRLWQEEHPEGIAVITDIRYDDFPKDEIYWLKNEMNGILVHIQRYTDMIAGVGNTPEEAMSFAKTIVCNKKFIEAPNEDERTNDPKLIAKADYRVIWPTVVNKTNNTPDFSSLNIYAEEFVKYLQR